MKINLVNDKKYDIRFMAQDFDIFGIEFDSLTVKQLDDLMERKIERLQIWLKKSKYTDSFLPEFIAKNIKKSTYYDNISNFSTLLHEYRTIRSYLIDKINPAPNQKFHREDEIYMDECNYSIPPNQYEKELKLQEWFTELSNPIWQFVLKKLYEYATNDLYFFELRGKESAKGMLWFDILMRNYDNMKQRLLDFNLPLTLADLEEQYNLMIEQNTIKITNMGNKILNEFAIQIARSKRISDLNSMQKFIALIKAKKVKPANESDKYIHNLKQYVRDEVSIEQSNFARNKLIAINYLESIKPSNLNHSNYAKNELFDERNDSFIDREYYSHPENLTLLDVDIISEKVENLNRIDEKINSNFRKFNNFLHHINDCNDLLQMRNDKNENVNDKEINLRINNLMNYFVNPDDIITVDMIRDKIQKVGLTLTMFKWTNDENNNQKIQPKTIQEVEDEKAQIIQYIISIEDDIDYGIVIPLIESIYTEYRITIASYDYIINNSRQQFETQSRNIENTGYKKRGSR